MWDRYVSNTIPPQSIRQTIEIPCLNSKYRGGEGDNGGWPPIIRRYSRDIFEEDCRTDSEFREQRWGRRRGFFSLPLTVSSQFIGSGPVWISRHVPKSFNDAKLSLRASKVRRSKRPSRESEDSIKYKSRLNTKDGLTVQGSRTTITSHRSSRILLGLLHIKRSRI